MKNSLSDVPGIKVGHKSDFQAITGCTVILAEEGATAGVDIRGGAPGTRETDCLKPMHLIERVYGIVLAGGSAYGLDAAGGVMQYLEEKGIGFPVIKTVVPIVPAAIIFDLGIGDYKVRPDKKMGYEAAKSASADNIEEGSVGVGTGATVGKLFGIEQGMKSGVGMASVKIAQDIIVAALAVCNAFGDVVDYKSGKIIAGARDPKSGEFLDTVKQMKEGKGRPGFIITNTTLGVVVTNAKLNKQEINKVAQVAQNGIAKAVSPAHTMFDGDIVFALSYGDKLRDVNTIGAAATEVIAEAIKQGVLKAKSLGGIPAYLDL